MSSCGLSHQSVSGSGSYETIRINMIQHGVFFQDVPESRETGYDADFQNSALVLYTHAYTYQASARGIFLYYFLESFTRHEERLISSGKGIALGEARRDYPRVWCPRLSSDTPELSQIPGVNVRKRARTILTQKYASSPPEFQARQ